MKIIDEKGRIFGKINVLDFLVVVFLVFLLPMFYFGYKILNTKKPAPEEQTIQIQVKVRFSKVLMEAADVMKEGDIIRDPQGNAMGTLSKILSNRPNEDTYEYPNKEILVVRDPQGNVMGTLSKILNEEAARTPKIALSYETREVVAIFDLDCIERSGTLYGYDRAIKIGLPIDIVSDWYVLKGVIIGINNK